MLKRNGEDCEHTVPDFPGRLTTSEFNAYNAAFPLVAAAISEFNERANTLSEIEKRSGQIAEQTALNAPDGLKLLKVTDSPESEWQIRQTLFKFPGSELLLCSRAGDAGKQQFSVVEKFDPQSSYARAHGEANLQLTGNNPFVLLQNFVSNERALLQMFRQDIEATTEENLSEKFPGQNHSRVVRAISMRCGGKAPFESQKQKPVKNITIRV